MNPHSLSLSELVTSFFVRHLGAELNASSNTIASYRDCFSLFLCFIANVVGKPVSRLIVDDLTPERILAFLEHLERNRGNSVKTRNVRLAAIRSFFAYAVTRDAAVAALAHKILAIPFKKTLGRILDYLTEDELRTILSGPDRSTLRGRRNYLVLALLYDTGARVQELVDLRPVDFRLDRMPLVIITGKGRKQRIVPLMPVTAQLVRQHLEQSNPPLGEHSPLLRNYRGQPLTRSGVTFLLDKYRRIAAEHMPTLRRKGISPHTLRHSKAMHLLQSGVAPVTIKDILGHAHLKTVDAYVHANLEMKRKALESTPSAVTADLSKPRHEPDLLRWLEGL